MRDICVKSFSFKKLSLGGLRSSKQIKLIVNVSTGPRTGFGRKVRASKAPGGANLGRVHTSVSEIPKPGGVPLLGLRLKGELA